ncbi:condensation domain-containing protein, partial [Longimicrobium sp.]|uniref:condensation domain-containing protein n=1 Tax=Longimicrobium sp. TaxID=2029185 RepID=UPI002E34984C
VALSSGATLVVAPRDATVPGEGLLALLRDRDVNHLKTTSSALAALPWGPLPALRTLVTAGEVCTAELMRRWAPGRTFLNGYGATETSMRTTSTPYADTTRDPPIGHPVPNTQLYVLDAVLEPAPLGVAGEIYIGGAGVGRGYLGRPALTAERFLPDPHRGVPGARLYRTGDQGRRRADGEVDFLGRVDFQVKVRGFRVEPGEIEAALRAHPAVAETVVLLREDVPGDPRLAAYVVPAPGQDPAPAALRAHLRDLLPEYMVPAAFVLLASLPLNRNGKADRRALPAPDAPAGQAYVAPRGAAEEILCGIWAQVLGVERVGVHDGFFDLGGHSLLATRVVSRARAALGVEVPLRALFEAPTVAGLAERVEALRSAGARAGVPPVVPAPRDGPLPLSFAQQRLWLVDRMDPGSAAYVIPYALRLRGALDAAALRAALGGVAARHEVLRTTFHERDGDAVQVVHPPAPVPLPVVDLRALPPARRADQARRLAGREALRPFDLSRGPLLRGTLLRLDDDDHVLCVSLHHIVSDGWSRGVLVREVSALYGAFARGGDAGLAPLPLQYGDFAVWQRAWLRGEVLEEELGYWRDRLAGAPPLLEVPTDRPRGAGEGARAGSVSRVLAPELSAAVRALARREGCTLFMTLLAAWQVLLARWSGRDDVVVGTPVAGRTRLELEGLIGFFVNMLPMRAELGGNPAWTEVLARVRETALGAYAHQHLPFERLVEALGGERAPAHAPVFQAIFTLHRGGAGEAPRLGDLRTEAFGVEALAAKYDFGLSLVDDGETLAGGLAYRSALFDGATAARMAGDWEALLRSMTDDPGRRLAGVSLLRGPERERVLEGWNAGAAGPPPAGCVHALFAAQAAAAPRAVAVEWAEGRLTYGELAAEAHRLAHHLRALGVGPETPVALCLERGPDIVRAMLAVLAAGGAYLPVDPQAPPARVDEILAGAGCRLAVTHDGWSGHRPAGVPLVRLDDPATAAALAARPATAPGVAVDPGQLAYVVYTSGSTGR